MSEEDGRDAALASRAAGGDREAFAKLVRRHHAAVAGLCGSMLGASRADDACQEAFLKAWEALAGFRGGSSFKTWLYRIAANRCLDLLRQEARRRSDSLDALGEDAPASLERLLAAPDDASRPAEQADLIEAVLGRLSSEHRLVLTLRESRGLSYDELAETLDCSLDAVKARLKRARAALEDIVRHFSARGLV